MSQMKSPKELQKIDATLDRLIQNAYLMHKVSTGEEEELERLKKERETLFNQLVEMDFEVKEYNHLQAKIRRLSLLNRALLRRPKERFVKKAQVHRNKN